MKWYIYTLLLFLLNVFFFSIISLAIYRLICSIELGVDAFEIVHVTNSCYSEVRESSSSLDILYIDLSTMSTFYTSLDWACFLELQTFYIYDIFFHFYSKEVLCVDTVVVDTYLKILFFTKITTAASSDVVFSCLQDFVYCVSNETVLVFFRITNYSNYSFECLTIYLVYPYNLSIYLTKLQCFCFGALYISGTELLELPVIFFLADTTAVAANKIYFFYLLLIR